MIEPPASLLTWPIAALFTGSGFALLTDDVGAQRLVLIGFIGVGAALGGVVWAARRGGKALVDAQTRRMHLKHEQPSTTAQRGMLSTTDATDGALSEREDPR